jgi:hypothetical protein
MCNGVLCICGLVGISLLTLYLTYVSLVAGDKDAARTFCLLFFFSMSILISMLIGSYVARPEKEPIYYA